MPHPRTRSQAAACTGALLLALGMFTLHPGLSPGAQAQPAQSLPPGSVEPEEPECIVTLVDGGQMSGRLVAENDEGVTIRVGSVLTTFKAEEIDRLILIEPVLERYRRMRRAIGDDPERILLLAEWLMGERRYALALREVERVLEIEPTNPRALEHKRLLEQQIRLLATAREHEAEPDSEKRPSPIKPREFPVLSPEQINLIRVFEVDLANPPKMSVPRETVEKILTYYADAEQVPKTPEGREALFHKRADQILDLLFQLRARELYGDVRVEEDPEAMRRFRVDVHNAWLVRGCATNRCHGGIQAGRLYLKNTKTRSDATVYTNFLILARYRTADGRPLIDYDQPGKSLLLELALPREISAYPHPPVNELGRERPWTPMIRSRDDARFRKTVAWIRSMYQPHPDYPIDYTPPRPVPEDTGEDTPRKPGTPR